MMSRLLGMFFNFSYEVIEGVVIFAHFSLDFLDEGLDWSQIQHFLKLGYNMRPLEPLHN
jgi:hypothetical protein